MKKVKKQKYTSLVGVKWTQESLENCLMDLYWRYYHKLDNNKRISETKRITRLSIMTIRFLSIYTPVKRYGVTVKKV